MPIFRPQRRRPAGSPRLGSTPQAITRQCLDSALACGRSALPNEFGGVLRADTPGIITDVLLLPGTTAGRRHANFQLYMMPIDFGVSGTVHSHPSGALFPSEADVRLFRHWGRRHVIIGTPFGPGSWRAYDGNGQEVSLSVVENLASASSGKPLESYRPRVVHRGRQALPTDREAPGDEA
ncbi:MAG: Mov34/MPN/PAD-1 family protein [Thermoplasmata archaeon]